MASRLKLEDLESIEALVRSAQSIAAQARLTDLRDARVPPEHRARFANLAWRSGLPEVSVSLLFPYVKGEKPVRAPTTAERAEYAQGLIRLGALAEGAEILEALDPRDYHEILLYRASSLISAWDYRRAAPLLDTYVRTVPKDSYASLVGQVNRIAALIYERRADEASESLNGALDLARARKATLLLGNCLELAAQLALLRREFEEAERYVNESVEALEQVGSSDGLFARKWKAVLEIRRKATPGALAELAQVRLEAVKTRHWETVRDCDFQQSISTSDARLFAQLYYGTPYPAYRERLVSAFPGDPVPPIEHFWIPCEEARPSTSKRRLDVERGEELAGGPNLTPGQLPHRLLRTLASDFYRPFRVAALNSTLFPGECFNPQSSIQRVHQVIKRLRKWFAEAEVPLSIGERRGFYRLEATDPSYSLRLSLVPSDASVVQQEVLLKRLEGSDVSGREFTALEAAGVLGMSKRNVLRLLRWAVGADKMSSIRRGPKSTYRFVGPAR